ncbi:rhodanese-related sulfurtransferase [Gammaproteobacteria bacterium]|nr:rhodanese-related sulfurtransferase [Gammaproteobacteria bacterium]
MSKAFVVIAMYKFVRLDDYQTMQPILLSFCQERQIFGTILLAEEGINGTVVGSRQDLGELLTFLKTDSRLSDLEHKESYSEDIPFHRMKVKLKKEIVTMGQPNIKPSHRTGIRIQPKQWNEIISDPDVILIDARNEYEFQVGSFKNAISPGTTNFREFPDFVNNNLEGQKTKKIAMFCTGGIRCEKASTYMLEQGFEEVYQLNGGILKYLEEIEQDESLWEGECFVFDSRISVDHQLVDGSFEQCFACRRPITDEDMKSKDYEKGVSCLHCINETTAEQRAAFNERQRQVILAKQRNQKHIGAKM